MKKFNLFIILAAAAMFLAACGAPATHAPASNTNTNTNTAKPTTAAAPTREALFELDKKANEAWIKGDKAYFEGMLSDKFVMLESGHRLSKSEMLGMVGSYKCDVKSWELTEPEMSMIDADTYAITYKGTFDGSCTGPEAAMKLPSPIRGASIYVRDGDKWKGAFHGENLIVDPKNPPPAPEKKSEAKKEESKKDDKAAGNTNTATATAPAKPTPSANTDALVKLHTEGWEAFKARDAKKFDEMLTANASLIDPMGSWTTGKANLIKQWTETMKCEGVTKVAVSDGFASALSPTVEILTIKGTADGTCEGQKNGDLWQTAVYVKEGDAWKLAFMFEALPME